MRVFGFVPFPKIVITDSELVAVLERLKSKVVPTLLCQDLGMDSVQKVECDPVIKSSVIMHLYKETN